MINKILTSKIFGEGEDFIILHGLFGMKDNWLKLAKDIENKYKVHLVDLRNHGDSFHDTEFNYNVMSNDLLNYMNYHNIKKANFIGHSMGGKVLMEFVCSYPDKANKIIIVDISPKYYKPHHQHIIFAMRNLDLKNLNNRKEAEIFLMEKINDYSVVMFLLKNLKRDENNKFYWGLNIDVIGNNLEEIGQELSNKLSYNGDILFIKGEKSNYIEQEDKDIIKKYFPNFKLQIVENSGHIVHMENYSSFYNILTNYLSS